MGLDIGTYRETAKFWQNPARLSTKGRTGPARQARVSPALFRYRHDEPLLRTHQLLHRVDRQRALPPDLQQLAVWAF